MPYRGVVKNARGSSGVSAVFGVGTGSRGDVTHFSKTAFRKLRPSLRNPGTFPTTPPSLPPSASSGVPASSGAERSEHSFSAGGRLSFFRDATDRGPPSPPPPPPLPVMMGGI